MTAPELTWFKSSYSAGPDGDSCVEIAVTPRAVHIRDSKTAEGPRPRPRFTVTPDAWTDFVPYVSQA
ncbi:DUF397 domain-containing protein [Streptomyces sp. NPDC050528]|uniref:DUF397 domain-containing protein n=1 Tax=unclassified Streptomyces TaxID=2593676 RepID=UPI003791FF17